MTYLETGVYRLSTLSPIHIRAGRLDYGQGFIRVDGTVYVVDTPKLQAEIFAYKGLEAVNTYTEAFSDPDSETNIVEVLNQVGYNYKKNIKKISKGIVRVSSGNRFMQSGLGQHFVPGSSIKGAIKTAVLYKVVKDIRTRQPTLLDDFVNAKITDYLNNYRPDDQRQRFAETLLEGAFRLNHPREHQPNKLRVDEPDGPFTDIFKAIKVKDTIIKKSSEVQLEDIFFTTLNSSNHITMKRIGKRFECFYGATTIEISIDHEILGSFKRAGATPPFKDLKSLIGLCQNFAQAQWKAEQQFLATHTSGAGLNLGAIKTFYADPNNKTRVTLRVGWGTGMLGTTVSLLLDEPTRVRLRNEVISNGQHIRPRPAPKSRRFVLKNNQPVYPLGWIELN